MTLTRIERIGGYEDDDDDASTSALARDGASVRVDDSARESRMGDVSNAVGKASSEATDGVVAPATPSNGGTKSKARLESSPASKHSTPGRGMPWSPRSTNSGSEGKSRAAKAAAARARRSDRVSDADVIAQFIGDEELTSSSLTMDDGRGAYEDMSSRGDGVRGGSVKMATAASASASVRVDGATRADGRGGQKSAWSTLVSYLRCCVKPGDATTASEMELAEVRREDINKSSSSNACVASSCVPCTTQPTACFESGFVLHEGDPFIGEMDLKCDPVQWRSHASPDAAAEPKPYKPCLVLDLDETLVHSSFKPVPNSDFIVPVEIDGKMTDVYVLKRPWVDFFLEEVSKDWELVVFTASLPKYANPVMDLLDVGKTVRWRLFRRHCYAFQGNYVKDLTCLGRDLAQTVIVDNSPYSYIFHPQNAFPISSFIDNPNDDELLNALPYLRQLARVRNTQDTIRRTRGCLPRQSYFSHAGIDTPTHDRHGNLIRTHAEMAVE
jgi:RNA polymerase II subunit A small phosphatase-like protein